MYKNDDSEIVLERNTLRLNKNNTYKLFLY